MSLMKLSREGLPIQKAAMVSPDMKSALAASRKDAWAASRSELVCGTAITALEQPQRLVVYAQVDLFFVLDALVTQYPEVGCFCQSLSFMCGTVVFQPWQ